MAGPFGQSQQLYGARNEVKRGRAKQECGEIETPQIVCNRILKAVDILGSQSLVYVAPDCGLRQLSLERAIQIYQIIMEGRELARKVV